MFIIGNGFDLSLGLKTGYNHFIGSSFFQEKLGKGYQLFDHLSSKIIPPANWVDIEAELVTYSVEVDNNSSFLSEYKMLCEALKSYINTIDLNSIDEGSEAFLLFSRFRDSEDLIVLNFNYTNSVNLIISKHLPHVFSYVETNVFHIHGSVEIDNIIFGVTDGAGINKQHSFLYKSSSSIYDGKACVEALSSFDNLVIFGHSLGESDHMYLDFFSDLIYQNTSEKEISIYFHGEESKYSLYTQLQELTNNQVYKLKNKTKFKEFDTLRQYAVNQ
ncbi:AbiH family protein [Alteromonadaceae bacterium BrNp21-10]|nr:AbiH family protein [Alteromonadaceae bacterium BrNp21-10]